MLGAGRYLLSNGAAGEDGNATGDLDALAGHGALTIAGHRRATTISAQGLGDRVLDVLARRDGDARAASPITGGAPPGEDGGGIRNAGTLTLVDDRGRRQPRGRGGAGATGAVASWVAPAARVARAAASPASAR